MKSLQHLFTEMLYSTKPSLPCTRVIEAIGVSPSEPSSAFSFFNLLINAISKDYRNENMESISVAACLVPHL